MHARVSTLKCILSCPQVDLERKRRQLVMLIELEKQLETLKRLEDLAAQSQTPEPQPGATSS